MKDKDKDIIKKFLNGEKNLYKKIKIIYDSIQTKDIKDDYNILLTAYFNDDIPTYLKYSNLIKHH